MGIRDCKFIGIQGSFGAAIVMSESSAVTSGNNTFANCTAYTGGSSNMHDYLDHSLFSPLSLIKQTCHNVIIMLI